MKMRSKKLHFKKIDSTSAYLLRRRFALKNYTFLSCDYQTNGRGRENRKWESERKKNLLFSVLVKSDKIIENFKYLSVCTALAVLKTVDSYGVKNLKIKFPNDVYCDSKKICGILLESVSDENKISSIVVGVGINVNQTDFSNDLLIPPTSIKKELNKKINLLRFRKRVYKNVLHYFNKIESGDFSFVKEIQNCDYLKGKTAYAEINGERCEVKIIGITENCELKVLCDNKEYEVSYGEITFHK